jgi:hypothetical protein
VVGRIATSEIEEGAGAPPGDRNDPATCEFRRSRAGRPDYIELINGPFLFELKRTPQPGLKLAIERDWLQMHESGTYVKFTQAGAELFA